MGFAYQVVIWPLVVMQIMSGFGLMFQLEAIYRPDVYIVCLGSPGSGNTPFERLAAFTFGLLYVLPMLAVAGVEFIRGTKKTARRAVLMTPILYHAISGYGVYFVFYDAINPSVSLLQASGMHIIFSIFFGIAFRVA